MHVSAGTVKSVHSHILSMDCEKLKRDLSDLSPERRFECLNNWAVTGKTALGYYAAIGSPDPSDKPCPVFELLITYGADPSVRCGSGLTPLIICCTRTDLAGSRKHMQSKIVGMLLSLHDCGVDVAVDARESIEDCTALLVSLASGEHASKSSNELIRRRINIDSRCYPREAKGSTLWGTCDQGETPLMMCVRMEDEKSLKKLLEVKLSNPKP